MAGALDNGRLAAVFLVGDLTRMVFFAAALRGDTSAGADFVLTVSGALAFDVGLASVGIAVAVDNFFVVAKSGPSYKRFK